MEQPSSSGMQQVFTPPRVAEGAITYLLSVMISWGLFGAIVVQFYTYVTSFPTDPWKLRLTVYFIVLLETVQTIMLSYYALDTYGAHFGDFQGTSRVGIVWIAIPFLNSIISFTVQVYLIAKILRMSEMRVLPAIFGFMAFVQAGLGIAVSVAGHILDDFRQFNTVKSVSVTGTAWVCVRVIVDISIAVCLAYQLYNLRTGFQRSEAVVWKLIRLFLETGSLTATVQIAGMILFFAAAGRPYHLVVANNLGRLYAINLLVIQNSRIAIRAGLSRTGIATSFSDKLRSIETKRTFSTAPNPSLHYPLDSVGPHRGRGSSNAGDVEALAYSNAKPLHLNSVDKTQNPQDVQIY